MSLEEIAKKMCAKKKGILAADESTGTMDKRLKSVGVESTEKNRLHFRETLFTSESMKNNIGGVILFDETIRQKTSAGISIPNLIEKNKIFAGLMTIPEILLCAKEVVKDDIKVCGLNYREPVKGAGEQEIHMDWKPRKNKKESYAGIVCMIYLDKSTTKNGSTRLVPKSHKKLGWPSKHINIFKKSRKEISKKGECY